MMSQELASRTRLLNGSPLRPRSPAQVVSVVRFKRSEKGSAAHEVQSVREANPLWLNEPGIQVKPDYKTKKLWDVDALRPTQMSVGMYEVNERTRRLTEKFEHQGLPLRHPDSWKADKYVIPVVEGPCGQKFVLDHHHLACVMRNVGLKQCWVADIIVPAKSNGLRETVDALAGQQEDKHFWEMMHKAGLMWAYDEQCKRVDKDLAGRMSKLTHVTDLPDNPWRGLVYLVRHKYKAIHKDSASDDDDEDDKGDNEEEAAQLSPADQAGAAFMEFRWTQFFHEQPGLEDMRKDQVEDNGKVAAKLALSRRADGMPGYIPRHKK